MPLPLDPQETFPVVLESDADKPNPPGFRFRFLSIREWRAFARVGDESRTLKDIPLDEALDALIAAIRIPLAGWTGMKDRAGAPIDYDPDRLEDVIGLFEAWELYYAARSQSRLEATEKKDSASPLLTLSAQSAGDAPPADAPISQA